VNALTPYAAFIMRLAVGGVFLLQESANSSAASARPRFPAAHHIPVLYDFAVILITVETVAPPASCWESSRGAGPPRWRSS
jgi:hypothetical protein